MCGFWVFKWLLFYPRRVARNATYIDSNERETLLTSFYRKSIAPKRASPLLVSLFYILWISSKKCSSPMILIAKFNSTVNYFLDFHCLTKILDECICWPSGNTFCLSPFPHPFCSWIILFYFWAKILVLLIVFLYSVLLIHMWSVPSGGHLHPQGFKEIN